MGIVTSVEVGTFKVCSVDHESSGSDDKQANFVSISAPCFNESGEG